MFKFFLIDWISPCPSRLATTRGYCVHPQISLNYTPPSHATPPPPGLSSLPLQPGQGCWRCFLEHTSPDLKTLQWVLSLKAFLWPLKPSVGWSCQPRVPSAGTEGTVCSWSVYPCPSYPYLGSNVTSPKERYPLGPPPRQSPALFRFVFPGLSAQDNTK